jgi:hypothetical protein
LLLAPFPSESYVNVIVVITTGKRPGYPGRIMGLAVPNMDVPGGRLDAQLMRMLTENLEQAIADRSFVFPKGVYINIGCSPFNVCPSAGSVVVPAYSGRVLTTPATAREKRKVHRHPTT